MDTNTHVINQTDIEEYLKIQKKKLLNIYPEKDTSDIISSIRNDIYDYIQAHPGCQMKDIDAYI